MIQYNDTMAGLNVTPATTWMASRQFTAMGKSGMEPSLTVLVRKKEYKYYRYKYFR